MVCGEDCSMTVLFEPKYLIGDTVYLKINPEKKYVIDGYRIHQLNDNNEVSYFQYSLYDSDGASYYYRDVDLELLERAKER